MPYLPMRHARHFVIMVFLDRHNAHLENALVAASIDPLQFVVGVIKLVVVLAAQRGRFGPIVSTLQLGQVVSVAGTTIAGIAGAMANVSEEDAKGRDGGGDDGHTRLGNIPEK